MNALTVGKPTFDLLVAKFVITILSALVMFVSLFVLRKRKVVNAPVLDDEQPSGRNLKDLPTDRVHMTTTNGQQEDDDTKTVDAQP